MPQKNTHVLMFGWEFPPYNSGGLGTACHGLSHALADANIDLAFVLPRKIAIKSNKLTFAFADHRKISSEYIQYLYNPYLSTAMFEKIRKEIPVEQLVSSNLINEVQQYSINARKVAKRISHRIIHAHDWLSFGAGLEAKSHSSRPLVVHVHATEYDRTGFNGVHPYIYHVEKQGMRHADRVVAVSDYTKRLIVKHYGIQPEKVSIVHNGIDLMEYRTRHEVKKLKEIFGKIVLFVGRLTLQKGPDYFLKAAQKVVQQYPDVTFVIAGSGDAEEQVIQEATKMGLAGRIFFTGFLRGDDLNKLFQASDLYIMPSVSEPFGIAALEAAANRTPVLVSKQSGVSEVLTHSLKVDFWDTDEMADKILSLLRHPSLYHTLRENSAKDIEKCTWHQSAQKMIEVYNSL